jgi:dimethylamine corrinoid protein
VIVGGAPISSSFAEKIGADGYSENAVGALRLVNRLLTV